MGPEFKSSSAFHNTGFLVTKSRPNAPYVMLASAISERIVARLQIDASAEEEGVGIGSMIGPTSSVSLYDQTRSK